MSALERLEYPMPTERAVLLGLVAGVLMASDDLLRGHVGSALLSIVAFGGLCVGGLHLASYIVVHPAGFSLGAGATRLAWSSVVSARLASGALQLELRGGRLATMPAAVANDPELRAALRRWLPLEHPVRRAIEQAAPTASPVARRLRATFSGTTAESGRLQYPMSSARATLWSLGAGLVAASLQLSSSDMWPALASFARFGGVGLLFAKFVPYIVVHATGFRVLRQTFNWADVVSANLLPSELRLTLQSAQRAALPIAIVNDPEFAAALQRWLAPEHPLRRAIEQVDGAPG